MAWCMPWQRFEPNSDLDCVVSLNDYLSLGFEHGHHAVGNVVTCPGQTGRISLGQPMVELSASEEVLGIGECRYPATVEQTGIPTHMIDMKVGAGTPKAGLSKWLEGHAA